MKLPIQIEIPRRAPVCAMRQENLTPGIEYFSILSEDPHVGVIRKDYCASCWKEVAPKTDIYWKSKIPNKVKEKLLLPKEKNQRALALLKKALADGSHQNQLRAFILALYLARKKILSAKQNICNENGAMITLYEVRENEEIILVPKFDLSSIPIEELQKDLAEQLRDHDTKLDI
jgi:hypothetical protein